MPSSRGPGRPRGTTRDAQTRSDRIAARIRSAIVEGSLPPGTRLPTWDRLASRHRVARPTVTRAVRALKDDGFIYSDSTRGTFVAERPPHLHRYAVVFGHGPQSEGWNRFWRTMSAVAEAERGPDGRDVAVYYDTKAVPHNESLRRLAYDVAHDRVAGMVFVDMYESGRDVRGALGTAAERIPVVTTNAPETGARIPSIRMDFDSFIDRSLAHVKRRGRSRLAVLSTGGEVFRSCPARARAAGLSMKEHWLLGVDVHNPWMATNVVHLLMDRPARDRPDCLVIADDNLVESGLAGLAAAGVSVPQQCDVLVHCNWQDPPACPVGVAQLGFDVREVLDACFEAVDAQREDRKVPRIVSIRPRLEDELNG